MGFWPFAWSWKTKQGDRVFVGGVIITPALMGLHYWFLNRGGHHHHHHHNQTEGWVEERQQEPKGDGKFSLRNNGRRRDPSDE